jgi:hypothetical protein
MAGNKSKETKKKIEGCSTGCEEGREMKRAAAAEKLRRMKE